MNSFTALPKSRTTAQLAQRMLPASILVATDGSTTSSSAYAAAEFIGARSEASVHVLSVLRPFPVVVPPLGMLTIPPGTDVAEAGPLEGAIDAQLAKFGRSAQWTRETRVGSPASVIARVAQDRRADLIIIGESHHGRIDRLFGEETAAQLARRVNLPLLVASDSMRRLPRRAIIAFNLGEDDYASLVRTLEILGAPPSVSCVHVQPRSELLGVDWAAYDGEYRAQVEASFERIRKALAVLPKIQCGLVILHGDPVTEINGFAESVRAEITVLGLKPRGPVALGSGGGVAMKVVRASHRPVLLIPRKSSQWAVTPEVTTQ
jgi:Universal stress protein UspA and related nucleotide-binding proteins